MPELASHGAEVERVPTAVLPTRRERLLAATRARLGGVPKLVWAITACYLGLLVCYSLLYPVYLGFDEPQHVDMTIALRHHPLSWPDPGERSVSEAIAASQGIVYSRCRPAPQPCAATDAVRRVITGPYLGTEIASRHDRKTIQQLGDNAPTPVPPGLPNQMVQHPPLYYAVGAAVLGVLPRSESLAYDQIISILRWISVLMIAPLPMLIWRTTRHLAGDGPIAIAASALPLAVPGLARGAGNYQNDNLLILAVAVLTLYLAKVMMGDFSRRTAVLVGIAMSVALLTKGTALPLTPLVPLAYAAGWWRTRGRFPLPAAVTACAVGAIGGLWWLRNVILYKTVQVNGYGAEASKRLELLQGGKPGPHPTNVWMQRFITGGRHGSWYEWRFWSGLGLLDQNGLSFPVFRGLTILMFVGVLLAVAFGFGRGRGDRAAALVLVLPLFLITAVVAYGAFSEYHRTGISSGIQGRYAYPAIPGLCALVAIGYSRIAGRLRNALPAIALAGALLVQGIALRGIVSGFWMPRTVSGRVDRYRDALGAIAAWSPWPVGVTYGAFLVAGLLTAAAVYFVVLPPATGSWLRRSLRGRTRAGQPPAPEAVG